MSTEQRDDVAAAPAPLESKVELLAELFSTLSSRTKETVLALVVAGFFRPAGSAQ